MRTTVAWWAPKFNMTDVLMKRGDLDTNIYTKRMLCKDKGRDCNNVAEAKEQPRLPAHHQKQEGMQQTSPSQPSGGTNHTDSLISHFRPPEP